MGMLQEMNRDVSVPYLYLIYKYMFICQYKIFNIGKIIYSNIIESILIFLPPESTSFCDLGFPGNVEKIDKSGLQNLRKLLLISFFFQHCKSRQYIFNPSSKVVYLFLKLKGSGHFLHIIVRSSKSTILLYQNNNPQRSKEQESFGCFSSEVPIALFFPVGFWHPMVLDTLCSQMITSSIYSTLRIHKMKKNTFLANH